MLLLREPGSYLREGQRLAPLVFLFLLLYGVLFMRRLGPFMIVGLLLGGCATTRMQSNGTVAQVNSTALPAPKASDLKAGRPYYLGPLDQLSIDVVGVPELNQRDIQVDASGRINFPLAGTIEVAGKTPVEAAAMIEQGLRKSYFRDPHVSVNLKNTVSQVVTIDGDVEEPGIYPVVGHMSLLRAIASAKGVTEFAKLDDVVILRTVDGKKYAALYNIKALRQGVYEDPEIYANDVVVVGDSKSRRLFKDILTVIPLLSTPIILLLQNG